MIRPHPNAIAQAILEAPAWARIGITAPSEWLREDAAEELARTILEQTARDPENGSEAAGAISQLSFRV